MPGTRTTRRATPRVVLDTNAVVSALIFRGGPAGRLRATWQQGHCLPLVSADTLNELIRVLAYPKFKLAAQDQTELLADYLPYAVAVRYDAAKINLLRCRDPFDEPFLHLAIAGQADILISGDRDLLALATQVKFQILTPATFLATIP